jgi:release factor glutamine methyltransferase
MRVGDALTSATSRLTAAGVPAAGHDAEALLALVLMRPRMALRRHEQLSAEQAAAYDRLVARREVREPLQHIAGRAAFRHVEVAVGPGVFVPRPETECLAGWAVEVLHGLAERTGRPPLAVDLCTGSGAVALALATEVPDTVVHAVELSQPAYDYARRNLEGSGVTLHLGDVTDAFPELDGQVDVVVANPPYVSPEQADAMDPEARNFDPPLALWAGEDGLATVRAVETAAARLLRPGGQVGCEHADSQGDSAPAVFAHTGRWTEVADHPDLAGRPRLVTARRRVRLAR